MISPTLPPSNPPLAARTRIKICGITRIEDGMAAVQAGADALGFVFYEKSPRYVTLERCLQIAESLPPFVQTVALFVNPEPNLVEAVMRQLQPTLLQFHGDEMPAFCEQFAYPYLRAIRVAPQTNVMQEMSQFPTARGYLLDSFSSGYGGSGKTLPWSQLPSPLPKRCILSGGLNADNVQEAIQRLQPFAVDVSSGVEDAPGLKSKDKIARFVAAVQAATPPTQSIFT